MDEKLVASATKLIIGACRKWISENGLTRENVGACICGIIYALASTAAVDTFLAEGNRQPSDEELLARIERVKAKLLLWLDAGLP